MTVLTPSSTIASRWNGALKARLRHAPLESFLRARGRKWVAAGDGRITDNLVCATLYFLEPALKGRGRHDPRTFDPELRSAAGEMTCAVSHGLAALIQEPASWRIAALVGTARLLAPHVGLDAAAHLAATGARDYAKRVKAGLEAGVLQVGALAAGAVERNDEALADRVGQLIAERLFIVRPGEELNTVGLVCEVDGI